jgi:hypothetical protein
MPSLPRRLSRFDLGPWLGQSGGKMIALTPPRICQVDHGRGTLHEQWHNILFWDIEAQLAIIQPP